MLAWLFVVLAALNALHFVLRASNPVIEADAWYFLDVFLRKAINGSLVLADFFVKRSADDHAQPLFKLLLLFNWRYFDLDFVLDAVVGLLAAVACALIYHRLVISERMQGRSDKMRYLAWVTICILLFSLNSIGVWTWPLVALENVTTLIVLLFVLAAWHAHRSQRYVALVIATLLLGISSDDSALIAVLATGLALLLAQLSDTAQRHRSSWKTFAAIGLCMALVRIGYACLSTSHGSMISTLLDPLYERFREGGWWQWIFLPLVLPVYYQNPLGPAHAHVWIAVQAVIGTLLFAAHVLFWRRALCCKYNLGVFTAVSTMLLTYGWVAGIILWRVSQFGNEYLEQPRYVLLYSGHLIALLLMWACSTDPRQRSSIGWQRASTWIPVAGCFFLLAVQLPQSFAAWHMRKYEWAYYAAMAHQIDNLTKDPAHATDCAQVQPACGLLPEARGSLTQLLSENRLNVYSPKVQRWHKYLPPLSPVPHEGVATAPDVESTTVKKLY
ncbi:hypothetical protein GCM10027065_28310 [Rhodanobacter koreensis]